MRSASRKHRAPVWVTQAKPQVDRFAKRVIGLFEKGVALQQSGQLKEALSLFHRVATQLETAGVSDASIYGAIGYTHLLLAEPEESLRYSLKALEIDPNFVKALINASAACRFQDKLEKAKEYAQRATEIDPRNAQALGALAIIFANQQKASSALVRASYALALDPNCIDAIGALAASYSAVGDMEMALPFYQRYVDKLPHDAGIFSSMLFSMHYKPDVTRDELREAHKTWGDRFGGKFKQNWPVHTNEKTTDRRLRIGYLSGDFRHHVVGYWMKHIVEGHNKNRIEVFCFANNKEDEFSQKFKAAADHWISVVGKTDAEVAQLIEDAKIDILVDLSGHTGGHRLLVLARKPAPVQASWCGYIDSTGLEAVDYVITDEVVAPPSEPSPYVEEPFRLSTGSVCFEQIETAPEVGPLPYFRKGYITFGCFHNPSKIGPRVVKLWSDILKAAPDSKLMMTYNNLADAFTRERVIRLFKEQAIPEERLQLRKGSRQAALSAYSEEIDLALDAFPYNGGTTTCEALWMGVPVVGLYGGHPMSRFTCSLLVYAGLSGLTTNTPEEYVERAVHLANNPDTLAYLRQEMRAHLAKTPLFNTQLFVQELENGYFKMFERWCQQDQA